MNVDKLLTTDLAALATTSRSHVLPIDALLPASAAPDITADQTLLALGRIYAHRVARTVAGSVAVVMTFALLAGLMLQSWKGFPDDFPDDSSLPLLDLSTVGTRWMGTVLLLFMLASYVLALGVADRVFDRRTEGSLDRARRLVRGIDGWAITFGIAGVVAFTTLIGTIQVTIGRDSWLLLMVETREWSGGPEIGPTVNLCKWNILVITAIALAISTMLGRACIRRASWLAWLEHGAIIPLGLALGFVTLYLGFALESLPITEYDYVDEHSAPLRQALTISGVTAGFLVVAGWTLRRRRREIERGGL